MASDGDDSKEVAIAKLSAKRRRELPKSAFVYPSRRSYPIHTKAKARSALRLSAKQSTYGSAATVRRAVYRRHPSLKPKGSSGAKRKRTRRTRGRSRR